MKRRPITGWIMFKKIMTSYHKLLDDFNWSLVDNHLPGFIEFNNSSIEALQNSDPIEPFFHQILTNFSV